MAPDSITIRKFKLDDYSQVIALWKKSGLPFKPNGRDSLASLKQELEKGIGIFFLALVDKKVVGSILGTHDGRKGWINRLAVDPNFQKQGFAKILLHKIEEQFDKIGLEIVTCLIEDYNTDSMQFFEKMGYIKHTDILYFSKRKNPDV